MDRDALDSFDAAQASSDPASSVDASDSLAASDFADSGDDAVSADGRSSDSTSAADVSDDTTGPVPLAACRATGSDWIPLPEASGAARLGPSRYLVVADSGNEGQALVVDDAARASFGLSLPLGSGAGDDIEGLDTAPDGRVFGVTSAGWLRAWRVAGEVPEATLVFGPARVTDDAAWVCDPLGVNCGPNYEGLCLHPAPEDGACAGWLVAKARGELVCLRSSGEGFVADPALRRPVAPANQLSGCAYEPLPPYRLVVAGNVYSGDRLWEVGEDDIEQLPEPGAGNQESVLLLEGSRPGAPRILSLGDLQELSDGQSPRVLLECR